MPRSPTAIIDQKLMLHARDLVLGKAKEYTVNPMDVVLDTRGRRIHQARKEVWRIMIGEWGLRRHQVAKMFNRDVRRLRKSVIGV